MIKSKLKWYWKNYSAKLLRIDNFAISKMGIIQSQTVLKIDNYMIICAPYKISMRKAYLFVVLNRNEIPFFTEYINKLASLKYTFIKTLKSIPLKFFVWARINRIAPLKGKENMCMIDVTYKQCPDHLINIIGEYIETSNKLEEQFKVFKDKQVVVNHETSRMLKFNDYIECYFGARKIEAKLISLSVNKLVISVPGIDPNLTEGYEFNAKLYFQTYRFFVKGRAESVVKRMDGFVLVHYIIEYVPELVDILHNYFTKSQKAAG